MKNKRENAKGFTLVELVVVIAIIGVLAGILVPSIMGYVRKSRIKAMTGDCKSIVNSAASAINYAYSNYDYGSALTVTYNGNDCGVITNYDMKQAQKEDTSGINRINYLIARNIVDTLEPNGEKFDFTKYSGNTSGAMGSTLGAFNSSNPDCPGLVLIFDDKVGITRLEYSNGGLMCIYDGNYNIYFEGEDEAVFANVQ